MLNEGMESPFVCREADDSYRVKSGGSLQLAARRAFLLSIGRGQPNDQEADIAYRRALAGSRPQSPANLSNAGRFSPTSFSILFAEAEDRPGRESQQPPSSSMT